MSLESLTGEPMYRAALVTLFALLPTPLLAADAPAPAAPEVSFALAGGWVEFVLEGDGKPVADARVTVLAGPTVWATGETGSTGRGTFPRPVGRDNCQVVFDLGAGPSAPVPLTFSAAAVTPARATVQGAGECCLPVPRPRPPAPPAPPAVPWPARLALAGAASALGTAVAVVAWRRARRPLTTPPRTETRR